MAFLSLLHSALLYTKVRVVVADFVVVVVVVVVFVILILV